LSSFSIRHYTKFREIPLDQLDLMNYSITIIDYNWTCLFVNANTKQTLGAKTEKVIGLKLLEAFTGLKFETYFEKLQYSVSRKIDCEVVQYSPLRDKNVRITGYALEDCYYFSLIPLPEKNAIFDDLRSALKRKKE
jgi:hypothetical protein